MRELESKGGLVEVIRNDQNLYDGNLAEYFQVIFRAQNIRNPYHNLRHMLHVTWLCYQACVFYGNHLSRRQVRTLLSAAMFHDFDHSGQMGNDDLNIERAVRGFRKHIAPEDIEAQADIETLIRITEYPYTVASAELTLLAQILRDADVSQALTIAWIQQVVIGLATEWGKPPMQVLRDQDAFHRGLVFHTAWAQELFPPEKIQAKITEANGLLEMLELI